MVPQNYKTEILSQLSKEALIDLIPVPPELVEKYEIELAGGTHSRDINGCDGNLPCGWEQEVKSQRYRESSKKPFLLRGRIKFGAPTYELYQRKLKSNELITAVGYDEENGDVYYRFRFTFAAIKERYLQTLGSTNCDVLPCTYSWHKSFAVDYIAPIEVLEANKHKFQPKFYNFLLDWSE